MKVCLSFLPWAIVVAALTMIAVSVYCVVVIWSLNFIFHLGINMFDLWAWAAIIILSGVIKARA
jgi:hypothetical protein